MTTPPVRRRGLGLLVVLTVVCLLLVLHARNPYAAAGLALLAPALVAELNGRGTRIARGVVVAMTAPLPLADRARWRQDLLASLHDPEDNRGALDFAIDTAIGMPGIMWRAWDAALPSLDFHRDKLAFEPAYATRLLLGGITCVLAPAILTGNAPSQVVALAGVTYVAIAVAALSERRPNPLAQRCRVVVTMGCLSATSMTFTTSPHSWATAAVLVGASGAVLFAARRAKVSVRASLFVTLVPSAIIAIAPSNIPTVMAATHALAITTAVMLAFSVACGGVVGVPRTFRITVGYGAAAAVAYALLPNEVVLSAGTAGTVTSATVLLALRRFTAPADLSPCECHECATGISTHGTRDRSSGAAS